MKSYNSKMLSIQSPISKYKSYQVILADPPWQLKRGHALKKFPKSSGRPLDYPVLDVSKIKSILGKASELGATDHAFFLWVINKTLPEAEQMMKELGYKLHTRMIWNKEKGIPTAFTIRFSHEYLLWFWKGKFQPLPRDQQGKWSSVLTERIPMRKRHSRKPKISYRFIESIYPEANRLELFARPLVSGKNKRNNWEVWGDEVDSDINLSLL